MVVVVDDFGVGLMFWYVLVGVWFGKLGECILDLFFGGDGFDCIGCMLCGNCMVGCCVGVKNMLMKNYFVFVEC